MNEYEYSVATILRTNEMERIYNFLCSGDEICATKKYTLFVSAHFGKSKQIDAEHHAKHFRNCLDRKILGRGKRLYKALFIEEGNEYSFNQRHAHWLIQKPQNMSKREFTNLFTELWYEVCGSRNIVIKSVLKKEGGLEGLITYLTKEQDADGYIGNRAFVMEASDNQLLANRALKSKEIRG